MLLRRVNPRSFPFVVASLIASFYIDCPVSRGIGYFLEALIALAPFAKLPLLATLTGVTNDNVDVSVSNVVYGMCLVALLYP